jgi:hypothetical protein
MTRWGRTIWLFPYTLLGAGVEPIGSPFRISVLRLIVHELEKRMAALTTYTYPHTHFGGVSLIVTEKDKIA